MVKGFIFNLDGVIVNTDKYNYLSWKEVITPLNIDFTETQEEELKGFHETESLKKILNWADVQLSEVECDRLLSEKNRVYLDYINQMDESEILPDVSRVLNFLKTHNQLIALSSTNKNTKYILRKLDLFDEFHVIIDGISVTQPKPNPEIFLTTAEKLHIAPSNCLVFDNTNIGMKAANSAKMTPIGIGNPKKLSNAKTAFKDLPKISNIHLKELIS